mgnify:CR=1 FL=1
MDLKRNGPRWVAPCPFHQETKPSFSVNEEQGLFYCFGCQASGDIFDFYGRKVENPAPGIYVVRRADGTTGKAVVR